MGKQWENGGLPFGYVKIAIVLMAIEIMSVPNMMTFHSYVAVYQRVAGILIVVQNTEKMNRCCVICLKSWIIYDM